MKTTFHPIALIAGGLPLLLAGWAGAAVLSNPPYTPNAFGGQPSDYETGAADDATGPLSHTDQGKAKDVQSGRVPTFVPPTRGGAGATGFTDGFGPSDLGAVIFDEEPHFDLGTTSNAPLFAALKLTGDPGVAIEIPSGGGFTITPVTTGAIPTPGSGLLLVLGGIVSVGARRRR